MLILNVIRNIPMPQNDIEFLARELLSAYKAGTMVPVLPSARPGFNLDAAYEVEGCLKQFRAAARHKAVGRKVGYANKAMWRLLKLETMVWAHMYDDTVHYSDSSNSTCAIAHARSLKVEPEIVFGLNHPIASGPLDVIDAGEALAATDWLAIGFEIIDCPFPGWHFQPSDFVASFGLHAALVVGERLQVQPANIAALVAELPRLKVLVSKNAEFVAEGFGRSALKSPALSLAELSSAIKRRSPQTPLGAGEVVSSGTLTAGHLTNQGDVWTVEVEGLSVSIPKLTMRLE